MLQDVHQGRLNGTVSVDTQKSSPQRQTAEVVVRGTLQAQRAFMHVYMHVLYDNIPAIPQLELVKETIAYITYLESVLHTSPAADKVCIFSAAVD